eukprot:gb/GEZJ01002226.1/.p1 GENE.gb/GEZJ01002226.1/~~gb/GEZJ01002226.1/.p1  ORF type:complete len:324 (-),score=32.67 gb/GEZJ01002226.1/:1860-2831(-)
MITDLVDVIGDPSRYGQPSTSAPLMSLLDIACGRCSALYSGGSVVTGCFDEITLYAPLRHGEVVAVVCEVVSTGKSSMFLRILASTYEPPGSNKGFATFVAIEPKTKSPRPLPGIVRKTIPDERSVESHIKLLVCEPELEPSLSTSFAAHRKQLRESSTPVKQLQLVEALQSLSFSRVMDVGQTEINIRKHFLPRNENHGGMVFGGDILETFESAALSCASRMQKTPMRTVAVRSISFLAAVQNLSLLHVIAKVIACTRKTVVVLIRSFIDQESNRFSLQPSHYGVFYLRTQDSAELEVGVQAWETDHDVDLHRVLSLPGGCD